MTTGRAAPAGDVEAHHAQLARGILPQHAQSHDADANVARGGLVPVVVPDPLGLLAHIAHLLPQDAAGSAARRTRSSGW